MARIHSLYSQLPLKTAQSVRKFHTAAGSLRGVGCMQKTTGPQSVLAPDSPLSAIYISNSDPQRHLASG